MSTDTDWKRWGQQDPYFGVLSDPRYRREALGDSARTEFFQTGEIEIAERLAFINRLYGDTLRRTAVDFGWGGAPDDSPSSPWCK